MLSALTRTTDPIGCLVSHVRAAKSRHNASQRVMCFGMPGIAPVRRMNSGGIGHEKNSLGSPCSNITAPNPHVEASVRMITPEAGRNARRVRASGVCFPSSTALIHSRACLMRRVCTTFLVLRLEPSFVVASTAHRAPRNGRMSGTMPATKDRAPARDCSCFLPTTGFANIVSIF